MILELKDGLLQLGSILRLIVALSVFNVVSFTWFILHVLGELIHESSILSVVDKASVKQGRYMRNRLNVITLLVLKAADRKFTDIGLKNTAHVLVFSLQYDFVKHEFWMHKFKDAYWSSTCFLLDFHSCITTQQNKTKTNNVRFTCSFAAPPSRIADIFFCNKLESSTTTCVSEPLTTICSICP
ncbi:hypothetical protein H5410_055185 [Solanum commersonii]|uniref:Uncharacterized protein n=1 Tax=Solanum commersonii TaxID=4109 RepID=A0A9J5WGX9_SOLCO|nr:hypothetical protein H5410_055185 [Solanum commersonii]